MTVEFLVTDALANNKTWTPGETPREACIRHENALRAAPDAHWTRAGKPALPMTAKASHYSEGGIVDVTVADSACVGGERWVRREV